MAQRKRDGERVIPPQHVLAHPLRVLILSACSRGEVSTSAFARQYQQKAANVRYHFKILRKAGYVEISREIRARGVMRRYYRAVRQAVLVDEEFAEMSARQRKGVSAAVIQDIFERLEETLTAGTAAANARSLLDWRIVALDLPGWKAQMAELKGVYERGFEIQAEALNRLRASKKESWIPFAFALAGFESPQAALAGEAALLHGEGVKWSVARELHKRCREALHAGTMDARDDSHLTWSPFILDRRGRDDLMRELRQSAERSRGIQRDARDSLRQHGVEPIPTTVALVGLESPTALKLRDEMQLEWPPALASADEHFGQAVSVP
jgi:DNA-binding transcriptional ArsR family regulator